MDGKILHPLVLPVITVVGSTQDGARPRSSTIILLLILYPGFQVLRATQQAYYETQLLSISTAIGSHGIHRILPGFTLDFFPLAS